MSKTNQQLINLFNQIATKINNDENLEFEKFSEDVVQLFIDFEEKLNIEEKTEEDFELLKQLVFVEF